MAEHNCRQMLGVLSDYMDGDLADELCAELERHLHTCPKCTVVVDTLRKTIELYQETTDSALFHKTYASDYMRGLILANLGNNANS